MPFTWTWAPDEIDVPVGGAVRWTNDTNSEHAVASGEGPWDTTVHLPIGGTAVLRFKKPGVYTYRCPLLGHSDVVHLGGGPDEGLCVGMCGVITVGG